MQLRIFRQCFKRSSFYSEIFVIFWIEFVDPVADLCLTNQIYSVLLNHKKSWSTKRELAPGRWRKKGDQNATSWLQVAETIVLAYFSQIENDSPTTNIHFLHSQQIFFVPVCICAGNPRVPPRVLKPYGGNNLLQGQFKCVGTFFKIA